LRFGDEYQAGDSSDPLSIAYFDARYDDEPPFAPRAASRLGELSIGPIIRRGDRPIRYVDPATGSEAGDGTTPETAWADPTYAIGQSPRGAVVRLPAGLVGGHVYENLRKPICLASPGDGVRTLVAGGVQEWLIRVRGCLGLTFREVDTESVANQNDWWVDNQTRGLVIYRSRSRVAADGSCGNWIALTNVAYCGFEGIQIDGSATGWSEYPAGYSEDMRSCSLRDLTCERVYKHHPIRWQHGVHLHVRGVSFFPSWERTEPELPSGWSATPGVALRHGNSWANVSDLDARGCVLGIEATDTANYLTPANDRTPPAPNQVGSVYRRVRAAIWADAPGPTRITGCGSENIRVRNGPFDPARQGVWLSSMSVEASITNAGNLDLDLDGTDLTRVAPTSGERRNQEPYHTGLPIDLPTPVALAAALDGHLIVHQPPAMDGSGAKSYTAFLDGVELPGEQGEYLYLSGLAPGTYEIRIDAADGYGESATGTPIDVVVA
jgi:hypothetical protein